MRPVITIFTEIDEKLNVNIRNTYINAVESTGGLPIVVPYIKSDESLETLIERCDGFIFSGGGDIDPKCYVEEKKPTCGDAEYNRDELEFRAFDSVFASGKPILAICRGIQLVNVCLGGTLYQDIPTEFETEIIHRQKEPDDAPSHEVNALENTPLYDLLKSKRVVANSFHHQAIKKLGDGLKITATADDGIIEGVYLPGERYFRAFQWHPERLVDIDEHNRLIFEDFINACR